MNTASKSTLDYYNNNAQDYFKSTVVVDMSSTRKLLAQKLQKGKIILDAGCGSGRDAKAFKEEGFIVFAFDASEQMAQIAQNYAEIPVMVHEFKDLRDIGFYDGVFANASLLHLNDFDLNVALDRIFVSLMHGGWFVATFKKGSGSEIDSNGRFFNYQNEEKLSAMTSAVGFTDVQTIVVTDKMGRSQDWITVVAQKPGIE